MEKYEIDIIPQYVHVDDVGRIMGITSQDKGVEVITEYNCSYALTEDNVAKYKIVNGEVVERTAEEIEADRIAIVIEPTDEDRLEAQVMYTALMTDTLIEV